MYIYIIYMDNLLMILLGFVIVYMFLNMCGKRVEGWGECKSSLSGCASEACEGMGHDDQCDDWQTVFRGSPLTCQFGISYHNSKGRTGNPYECR